MTPAERRACWRLLTPLCAGRVVAFAGAPAPDAFSAIRKYASRILDTAEILAPAQVIIAVEPHDISQLEAAPRRLGSEGVLALCGSRSLAAPREFPHAAKYLLRPVRGVLAQPDFNSDSSIAALPDLGREFTGAVVLASHSPLPHLVNGIFEQAEGRPGGPTAALIGSAPPPAHPTPPDLHRRAVSLVKRLIETDERAVAQYGEIVRLRAQRAESGGGTGGSWFMPPRTKHPWPLRDSPERDPASLGLYERRPDDAVVLAERSGREFMERFALLSSRPDFSGAVDAINALHSAKVIASDLAPDASIIVPVYGQLPWTLNCLHGLLSHESDIRREIIVVDDQSPDDSLLHLSRIAGIRLIRNLRNLGFLRSCNAAAREVRGNTIVLLNNDTRVLPGWLNGLLSGLASLPNAGLVGSKMLFPEATLQEAGAIMWRDGSAWNYGRDDDPNRPEYCHARVVDYISGASIALRREVWDRLEGFDEAYVPAYCEDADLGMRINRLGLSCWYQPSSRVIHYEGRTSGTDTTLGVKSHQVTNSRRFLLRWHKELEAHRRNAEAPYFERERCVRRRALVIDAVTPTPKQDAGSVTTVLTMQLFRELGYKTHFVPEDNFLFDRAHTPPLQSSGIECAYAPYEDGFETYIRRYGFLFDVVLVFRPGVLTNVLPDLRQYAQNASVIFHVMDLHFLRMEREADSRGDAAERAAAATMRESELELISKVDATITHSTFERDLLAQLVPSAPVVVWPFMFEFHGTRAAIADRRDICFLGGYRHAPNVDAVLFFVREVLPLIRAEEPGARFIAAGANPPPEVLNLAGQHVEVTGLIDDLRDLFDRCRVFVCPLRVGAGTKGKVSTAMSYGIPVVSTSCGAEGMDLIDGDQVLIADDPKALAAACLRVYRDEALWGRLSLAGQALVREKHSLDIGRAILTQTLDRALRHRLELSGSGGTA